MAFYEEDSEAMRLLEAMIDKAGVGNLAYAVAKICSGKAEHVAANWQDTAQAKLWLHNARQFEAVAHKTREVQ